MKPSPYYCPECEGKLVETEAYTYYCRGCADSYDVDDTAFKGYNADILEDVDRGKFSVIR